MKSLADRIGHDPSHEEYQADNDERFADLEKRVKAVEKLADEKEGRPSESGAAKAKDKQD